MSLFASLSLFISSMRGSMNSITHPPTLSAATLAPVGEAVQQIQQLEITGIYTCTKISMTYDADNHIQRHMIEKEGILSTPLRFNTRVVLGNAPVRVWVNVWWQL